LGGSKNRPQKDGNDIPKQKNCVMLFFNVKYTDINDSHTNAYAANQKTGVSWAKGGG
jgi:hypothetical protein